MRNHALLYISSLLLIAACGGHTGNSFELDPDSEDGGLDNPGFGTPDDPCDGLDNNVDGTVDEGCYCEAGETQSCFAGAPELAEVGACRQLGIQTCEQPRGDFGFGRWSACLGGTQPSLEVCGNDVDEDCDGFVAPCQDGDVTGTPCHPGESQACFSGPPGTQGLGICAAGVRFCGEFDVWGPCEEEVLPATEVCGNGVDEDCDGLDADC